MMLLACASPAPPPPVDCPTPGIVVGAALPLTAFYGAGVAPAEAEAQLRSLERWAAPMDLRVTWTLAETDDAWLLDGRPGDSPADTTAPLLAWRAAVDAPWVVVFLRALLAPGSQLAPELPELRGLGLGPTSTPALAPTVLVGLDAVAARAPWMADTTLAHELGHALGLPHVSQAGDLMVAGGARCRAGLTATEAATVRAALLR